MSDREAMQMALDALNLPSMKTQQMLQQRDEAIATLRAKLEQPEQEPVAWMDREGDLYRMPVIENWSPPHTLLYAAPPQRQWSSLTDDEIKQIALDTPVNGTNFARAIEEKLKEKNHDTPT